MRILTVVSQIVAPPLRKRQLEQDNIKDFESSVFLIIHCLCVTEFKYPAESQRDDNSQPLRAFVICHSLIQTTCFQSLHRIVSVNGVILTCNLNK